MLGHSQSKSVESAQSKQKKAYDRKANDHHFQVGDRVMIHMPGTVAGKSWKLARPYHGPYRVISVTPTNVEARLVDDVDADSIFVSVNRVRLCPPNLPDNVWIGKKKHRRSRPQNVVVERPTERAGPVTRSMTSAQAGD